MSKFMVDDARLSDQLLGAVYDGHSPKPLSKLEEYLWEMIQGPKKMAISIAEKVVASISSDKVWYTRAEFIRALAALSSIHHDEVCKVVPGPNRSIAKLLYCATDPDRMEWYWNIMRMRIRLPSAFRYMQASGTTSNEALHAKLKNNVSNIQVQHQATL